MYLILNFNSLVNLNITYESEKIIVALLSFFLELLRLHPIAVSPIALPPERRH
jgi:hypothetical protein